MENTEFEKIINSISVDINKSLKDNLDTLY